MKMVLCAMWATVSKGWRVPLRELPKLMVTIALQSEKPVKTLWRSAAILWPLPLVLRGYGAAPSDVTAAGVFAVCYGPLMEVGFNMVCMLASSANMSVGFGVLGAGRHLR